MASQTPKAPSPPTVTDGSQHASSSTAHTIPASAILATERFYLRRYEASDAAAMAAAANDPEVARHLRSRFPSPYSVADARDFIAHCASLEAPALTFGIFTPDGQLAGSIALEPPRGDPIYAGTRELGYWGARKFWGRGIMSEVVRELTRWAFATVPDLLRIEATVFEPNKASQRVLEKAGFVKEGTQRLAAVKNGKQMGEVMFGLIRTDIEA
ncbi:acetyltransferase [Xylaria sp. FL1777]|nr:acetyltransferase [Xylaria sp. FL1777]